jgi:hypothetical protein
MMLVGFVAKIVVDERIATHWIALARLFAIFGTVASCHFLIVFHHLLAHFQHLVIHGSDVHG